MAETAMYVINCTIIGGTLSYANENVRTFKLIHPTTGTSSRHFP